MAKKAAAPACKCKKSECEECPEWIFTFADLVMLMMGFFVILWVTKPSADPKAGSGQPGTPSAQAVDQHWIDQVAAIRNAFDYSPKPTSTDPIDVAVRAMRDHPTPAGAKDQGRAQVHQTSQAGTDDEATAIRAARQNVTGGRILFARGGAELTPETTAQLDQVAEVIRGHRQIVLVQGHTALDDLDESATPMQKLTLSIRRAEAVADRLTADGVSPDVLRVVGASTFEPVTAGQYGQGSQADNRRVEVQLTPMPVTDVQAQRPTAK